MSIVNTLFHLIFATTKWEKSLQFLGFQGDTQVGLRAGGKENLPANAGKHKKHRFNP